MTTRTGIACSKSAKRPLALKACMKAPSSSCGSSRGGRPPARCTPAVDRTLSARLPASAPQTSRSARSARRADYWRRRSSSRACPAETVSTSRRPSGSTRDSCRRYAPWAAPSYRSSSWAWAPSSAARVHPSGREPWQPMPFAIARLSDGERRLLVACSAGAGMAAAYGVPARRRALRPRSAARRARCAWCCRRSWPRSSRRRCPGWCCPMR
jgi:hypothetical protein